MQEKNLCHEVRERYKLTQKELAKRLKLSERTIIRWEQRAELSVKALRLLASFDTERAI